MKIDSKTLLTLPLAKIQAATELPFPIYLHLPLNKRYILIRGASDTLGEKMYATLQRRGATTLYTTPSYAEALKAFLEGNTSAAASAAAKQQSEPPSEIMADEAVPATEPTPALAEKTAVKEVEEVFANSKADSKERSDRLVTISKELLNSISKITSTDEADRAEGLSEAREITDQILHIAAQNSNIYDEILTLRSSQEDIEHSIIVGTIASMFAMAIGTADENVLSDLVVAALFHDIGLVKVNPEILVKVESSWSATDRQEYEKHVLYSMDMLEESGSDFSPRVYRYIKEHHENYDGSGFPSKLAGSKIDEMSQILHLANLFDRYCTGKQTGAAVSPADAFKNIHENSVSATAVKEVRPELVQRVFQFMQQEKDAETIRAQAQSKSDSILGNR